MINFLYTHFHFFKLLMLCSLLWIITGCSNSHSPAPVEQWQTQKTTRTSSAATSYQVKNGDTLYSIAFRSGMDFRTLARINRIAEPYTIYVGQRLIVLDQNNDFKNGVSDENSDLTKNKPENSSFYNNIKKDPKLVAVTNQKRYGQEVDEKKDILPSPILLNRAKVKTWHWPVKGPLLAKFSNNELGNKGIDIGGALGAPIKAAANGQVVYAGDALRGYGNLIIIRHNDDFLSAYAHNHRLFVIERQSVVAGQVIAEMGSTDADRVQLHFEIRFRGKSVDPLRYLK